MVLQFLVILFQTYLNFPRTFPHTKQNDFLEIFKTPSVSHLTCLDSVSNSTYYDAANPSLSPSLISLQEVAIPILSMSHYHRNLSCKFEIFILHKEIYKKINK